MPAASEILKTAQNQVDEDENREREWGFPRDRGLDIPQNMTNLIIPSLDPLMIISTTEIWLSRLSNLCADQLSTICVVFRPPNASLDPSEMVEQLQGLYGPF